MAEVKESIAESSSISSHRRQSASMENFDESDPTTAPEDLEDTPRQHRQTEKIQTEKTFRDLRGSSESPLRMVADSGDQMAWSPEENITGRLLTSRKHRISPTDSELDDLEVTPTHSRPAKKLMKPYTDYEDMTLPLDSVAHRSSSPDPFESYCRPDANEAEVKGYHPLVKDQVNIDILLKCGELNVFGACVACCLVQRLVFGINASRPSRIIGDLTLCFHNLSSTEVYHIMRDRNDEAAVQCNHVTRL